MKPLVAASLLVFTVCVPPVQAGSHGGAGHAHSPKETAIKYFEQMDQNGDEVVTKAEFEMSPLAKMVKSFNALQPNDKGLVKKSVFIENFIEAHSKPELKT